MLGIGDDAAVLDVPADRQLVLCTDTLVENVHFPGGSDPRAVGHKSLAVNLSDLAAMGAEPAWFLLSLALPRHDPDWVDAFAKGMAELARDAGILLVGGDTTRGDLCITVTVAGLVSPGKALTRGGARPGDHIIVSGKPGCAAFGLLQLKSGSEPDDHCRRALEFPQPRLALGALIGDLATACIDLSDGLLADLGHILDRSGTGAELKLGQLPPPACLEKLPDDERLDLQLAGGDDYELCFTVPPAVLPRITEISNELALPLSDIGKITDSGKIVIRQADGSRYEMSRSGYQHFSQ